MKCLNFGAQSYTNCLNMDFAYKKYWVLILQVSPENVWTIKLLNILRYQWLVWLQDYINNWNMYDTD